MKKQDIILVVVILFMAIIGIVVYQGFFKVPGNTVVITIDGEEYKRLPLEGTMEIDIPGVDGGHNHLVIRDGYADIVDASCPDLICVNQRKIHYNGETLVCLPNKVVVTIESDKESQVDGVAK